ncbi:nucleotide exchange factor GrpE [Patescibacteria group bacterium]|nr:nucleotide exchange factor GrpE [Patescibacteria group bacterium]MBU1673935.1 nucleotide exchange factor GrpE [Patescibacteria group bacterium]MBU1963929.1 nucleotide exchange factor GrpE [Patescibacteria group bacterium]
MKKDKKNKKGEALSDSERSGELYRRADLEKKCAEYLDGWKRSQAEMQNLQKSTEKQMSEFRKYACEDMLMQILPLVDYFKHAFNAVPEDERESDWIQGMKHIQDYLYKFLEDNNIEEIKTVGEKFDPELHEAIKEEKGEKDNIIIKETQSGFRLNGKVVQPAKVIISRRPSEASAKDGIKEKK